MASLALMTSSCEILGFLILEEPGPPKPQQVGRCSFMGLPVPPNLLRDPLNVLIQQYRQKPMTYAVAEAAAGLLITLTFSDGWRATLELNGDGQGTCVFKKEGAASINGHCELSRTA